MKTTSKNPIEIRLPFTDIVIPQSSLAVVAGRPGMGCSAYLKEIILQNQDKLCFAYFPGQSLDRFVPMNTYPVYVSFDENRDIEAFKTAFIVDMERKNPDYVLIDQIERLTASRPNSESDSYHDKIIDVIYSACKETRLPIIISSHVYASADERGGDRRPELQDINNSALEIYSDVILGLYRPAYYGIEVDEKGNNVEGFAEAIALKNSFGKQRSYQFGYDEDNQSFHSTGGK